MRSNFDKCMDVILKKEGGYVNHPRDPGGPTNMGITIYTLSDYRKKECSADDVKNLTVNEACEIYRQNYWEPLSCDDLPSGLDLSVFDMGVNAGVLRGAKILQKIVGARPDGIIGSQTLLAVNEYVKSKGVGKLLEEYKQGRIDFYCTLPTFDVFGQGWKNRANTVYIESLEMTKEI